MLLACVIKLAVLIVIFVNCIMGNDWLIDFLIELQLGTLHLSLGVEKEFSAVRYKRKQVTYQRLFRKGCLLPFCYQEHITFSLSTSSYPEIYKYINLDLQQKKILKNMSLASFLHPTAKLVHD